LTQIGGGVAQEPVVAIGADSDGGLCPP